MQGPSLFFRLCYFFFLLPYPSTWGFSCLLGGLRSLPAFSGCSVGAVPRVDVFLLYLWEGKWSPRLTLPPSSLLPSVRFFNSRFHFWKIISFIFKHHFFSILPIFFCNLYWIYFWISHSTLCTFNFFHNFLLYLIVLWSRTLSVSAIFQIINPLSSDISSMPLR